MRALLLSSIFFVSACGGGPTPPAWQSNAKSSLDAFQQAYLRGDTRVADAEFALAKRELASTGNVSLVARAELTRCAVRIASLEFEDCSAFEALRRDAGAEEAAYADFLSGKIERPAGDEALSKLVAAGVRMKSAKIAPPDIAAAIDISSTQGWRRPLLAWLRVEEMRLAGGGDTAALERIRRRIALVSGR